MAKFKFHDSEPPIHLSGAICTT